MQIYECVNKVHTSEPINQSQIIKLMSDSKPIW